MYKRHLNQISLLDDPEMFDGIKLDKNNEWVKLAKIIPWSKLEEMYADQFKSRTGQPAISFRMALGSLLIKERYGFSDEETVAQITMNPYLQYFIGLGSYTTTSPFDSSMMTRFRKRITPQMLSEINDQIIGRPKKKDDDSDKGSGNDGSGEGITETKPEETSKQGTLILDATCAPQNIQFPTDARLLNDARVLTEKIIDSLHEAGLTEGKKPRTYREKAKKQYNRFSKNRKKTKKLIRKTIGQQLRYLRRNLGHIEKIAVKYPEYLKHLAPWLRERLAVIRMLYEQQKEMSESGTHRISDRIVSLSQPWVRPIVRGKQTADVEFGAKVEMSDVGGYLRVEDLRWNAFNESTTLQASVESYRECYGCYPERVLADKIFRTRENLKYCKERGIHLNGPKLGKPNQDPKVRKAQQYQEWLESGERGDIERRFGISKRCYSLGLVMTKLKHTSEVSIHLSVLTLNLQRKLRLLLRTFFRLLLMPLPAYVVQ